MSRGRLLITGGAGDLGSRIARIAAGAGWEVVVTRRRAPADPTHRAVEVDLRDPGAVRGAVAQIAPDVIVHTAYDKHDNGADSVTQAGTAALAGATDARLVFTSTDVVFSGHLGRPYTEADPPDPINDYGRAKTAAEASLADRTDTLITRLSLLVDPDTGPQVELVRAAARGDATLFTDEVRCPALIDDVAEALVALAAGDEAGVLHLGGPDAMDRAELGRLLAPAAGVDPDDLAVGTLPAGSDRPADLRLDSARAAGLGLRLRRLSDAITPR